MWPGHSDRLEVWAGLECTMNRLERAGADVYPDQLEMSGHYGRPADIDLLASLGVKRVRYPVLWERCARGGEGEWDWSFADERLPMLLERGIRPIVGLTHHGGGPAYTSLLDPEYPAHLADFARAVAERYPWIDAYTPVNEPNTTARFSALYGHWHPHLRDEAAYVRALISQVRGTALAMRAIREVNPRAQLVATDDLGKTYSTRMLRYQADYENERRFLGWDLLFGRVVPGHPLWERLTRLPGITADELLGLAENPCPPDLIGVNHYITSERFLDEHAETYPAFYRGGNGRDRYADTELLWMDAPELAGPRGVLRETWERYGAPIAVTEVHLTGEREEQLRWLLEVYRSAQSLRAEGADIRAITAWSALGTFDWDRLVTDVRGFYESGLFDVRSDPPRPTAAAGLVASLAAGHVPDHPVLEAPGWWRRPERVRWRHPELKPISHPDWHAASSSRPVLVLGAGGTLGSEFVREFERRAIAAKAVSHASLDVTDEPSVRRLLLAEDPWAVINAAGYVRVDDAENDAERCLMLNALAPRVLADACRDAGVQLVTFSSDLVFDGAVQDPYRESHPTGPLGVYGRSKELMERLVADAMPDALIIRTSSFFGPRDDANFLTQALSALSRREAFRAADDLTVSPTYVPHLVWHTINLLIDRERGVWHLVNRGAVSWFELAAAAAKAAGIASRSLVPVPHRELGLVAKRPVFSAMRSERAELMPGLEQGIADYVAALQ